MQRPIVHRLPSRRLAGVVIFGLLLDGFCGVVAAESASPIVPTASGYFLGSALPDTRGDRSTAAGLGEPEVLVLGADAGDGCQAAVADNPFCELRWTTGRSRGSDIRARYYEVADDVKTRIVGRSRAEYFDLDLDSNPEFLFKLRF